MKYRVDLDFIRIGSAAKAYGGKLDAWSFIDIEAEEWFNLFRQHVLSCMRKKYLPVYRMADGEYRFLMGRKYNWHNKPLWKEVLAVTAEKIKLKNSDNWETSWGEKYSPQEVKDLRNTHIQNIRQIANSGYLACYINDNGLHAFTEFNKYIEPYFAKNNITFNDNNYIPFHFVAGLLVNKGWQEFYENKNILVVSGTDDSTEKKISSSIKELGANRVEFLRISKSSSMKDKVDLSPIKTPVDLCLVAAGIGSANIIMQLEPLNTVVLDIGGYINCFLDKTTSQHGGIFKFPKY